MCGRFLTTKGKEKMVEYLEKDESVASQIRNFWAAVAAVQAAIPDASTEEQLAAVVRVLKDKTTTTKEKGK